MNFTPYKTNGLELSIKKKLDAFKMQISMLLFNDLSKKNKFNKFSLSYNQKPNKISLKYLTTKDPYNEIYFNCVGSPKINPFKNLDCGFSCNLNQKHSINLNYYELFLKGTTNSYEFLGALTSNKGGLGQRKLSPGILTLALKKKYRGRVVNMVLEHHLQEKTSLLSACYESNLEETIIMKNLVFSFINSKFIRFFLVLFLIGRFKLSSISFFDL